MPPLITYTTADLKALTDRISGYSKVAHRGDGAFTSVGNPAWYTWYDDENATGDLGDLILKPDDNTGFWVVTSDRTYYGSGAPPTLPLTTTTMNALGSFRWIDTTTGTVYDYAGAAGWLVSTVGGNGLIASSGLVAEYRFDEMSGTTINDSSGNGRHGSILGTNYEWPAWTPRGLQLNGGSVGGYVDVSQASFNWFGTNGFTIEVVAFQRSNAAWARWFTVGNALDDNDIWFAASNNTSGQPALNIGFALSPSGGFAPLNSARTVTLLGWQHWRATAAAGTMQIFLNGGPVASTTYTGSFSTSNRSTAWIGRSFAESLGDARLNSVLALVRIYNRALTTAEASANLTADRHTLATKGILL